MQQSSMLYFLLMNIDNPFFPQDVLGNTALPLGLSLGLGLHQWPWDSPQDWGVFPRTSFQKKKDCYIISRCTSDITAYSDVRDNFRAE